MLQPLCALAAATAAAAAAQHAPLSHHRPPPPSPSALADAAVTAAAGAARCTNATSVSLQVAWEQPPPADSCDLYYCALSSAPEAKPFALQTSAVPALTLHDLLPNSTYWLRWRCHPTAAQRNIGWDWGEYTQAVACATEPADAESLPSQLHREGDLAEDSISVAWAAPTGAVSAGAEHLIGHRVAGGRHVDGQDQDAFVWSSVAAALQSPAPPQQQRAVLMGLAPGVTYDVAAAVRLPDGTVRRGPALPLRTAAPGVRYTQMYRISEFTDDVDFLDNHDSATSAALAVLLARMAKQVNVSQTCLDKLAQLCPQERGQGASCTACVAKLKQRPAGLPAACGDKEMSDYNTHFFCGEGWPSFSMFSTPMSRYCVEDLPAPLPKTPTHDAGWAEYLSCDCPEAGESNHPTDPRCICWVSWDRVAVSHQPKSVYDNYCKASSSHAAALAGEDNGGGPSSCSCADAVNSSSVFVRPDAPSARYVGKSPVMLPYTYYTKPAEDYPNSTHIGDNFSTPKNGSCAENATLGLGKDEVQDEGAGGGAAGGCVWKRQASVGIIYYPQLLEAGWDASLPHDTPDDLSGSQHNIAAMASAWETGLGRHMSPRCCGC